MEAALVLCTLGHMQISVKALTVEVSDTFDNDKAEFLNKKALSQKRLLKTGTAEAEIETLTDDRHWTSLQQSQLSGSRKMTRSTQH